MSRYWSEITKHIKPYVPGEQPGGREYLKLNTNENPYPPSPKVLDAIKQAANESLRRYPDPLCSELRAAIADYYGLGREQVFVGNGSDEVLAFAFPAFFNPGDRIFSPDVTYTFYKVYAALFRVDYIPIPLDEDFSIPVEMFFRENRGIIIPNPNAPTGKYMPIESVRSILEHNRDSVVIIDEAYVDFGGESAAGLIRDYPNLLVVQTLSKSRSLAGLRVGFALGQEGLIEGLDRIKNSINSYTLDRLALAGAREAIRDKAYFEETTSKVINTRERVSARLAGMGFKVIPSKTNFVFISHALCNACDLFRQLKGKGILVRYFNEPRIDNYLRVSIGSDDEMDRFLRVLEEIVASL
ncbi:MAG: histidinol-phosphate transaminase [Nitrospirae bacterium]|nr:histidinol-phosphate transaminase [Nitrospirota bacterium]